MTQGRGRHSHAHIPKVGMSIGNGAILSVALLVRTVTLVMRVLGTKTPATCLPEGTLLFDVVGVRFIAFEAVGELGLASLTPLA